MGAKSSCCNGPKKEEHIVTKLDLSHSGCTEVPNIVFQSERCIENLNMCHNRLLSLPPQLFHCQELRHLNLIDNGLDSIPPAIGSLLNLISLKLDKNYIKDLPENLKNCRKLKRLSLSNNAMLQIPQTVTQLINLEELCLNDCDLNFLPASIGRLTKLRVLELRNNRLGNLPLSMNRLGALNRLDIGDNSFTMLPECTPSLVNLQELLVDNNDLESLIGLINLTKLEHLDVSYNNIKAVTDELGTCSALNLLNLGWNYLETLPDSISGLRQLQGLVLEMNEMTTLPRGLGHLDKLEEFNVANNRLCDIPVGIGLLRNLMVLNISRNFIQELPAEIGSCQKLSILNTSYNRLQALPAEIGYLNNLKVIDVVGNFIMYLPISMSNLTNIRAIWLSANQNVPLIPFTEEVNVASGERFLTNIALPQLGETAVHLDSSEKEPVVEKSSSFRKKIRFEEDEDVLPGRLDRTPTPFPKELRCPAKRQQTRQEGNYVNVVDGHVAVFQEPNSDISHVNASSDGSTTVIREANIRKNRDVATETDSQKCDLIESTRHSATQQNYSPEERIYLNQQMYGSLEDGPCQENMQYPAENGNCHSVPLTNETEKISEDIKNDNEVNQEINRNFGQQQVIYSNLKNGNVYTNPTGYYQQYPIYEMGSTRPVGPIKNPIYDHVLPNNNHLHSRGPSPYNLIRHSPQLRNSPNCFEPVRQSPLTRPSSRQSPYSESYGVKAPYDIIERPPSKQEMLDIAERNRSQNIPPPCYEIAKMYSTKAALFESQRKS